jgi:D-alanyl-D-alanine carboxypeptidase
MGLPRRAATGAALLTTAALIGAGLSSPAIASSGYPPAPPSAGKALQAALNAFVAHPDASPGIIVTIGNGSALTVRTAGVADVVTKAKLKATDHMRVASVAKAFSGAAALSLVAQGKLSLNDTIGKWLPSLPKQWHAVTLRALLGHTSGIVDFSDNPKFREDLFKNLQTPPPHVDLLKYAPDKLVDAGKYHYSNTDNIIVALIIEAATHRSYESVLATNVYAPLHLGQTSLPNGSAMPVPFIHGYGIDPPAAPEDVTSAFAAGWTWASGGVVSTPADLVRFIEGYARGATTNAKTHAAQFTFVPGSSEPPGPGTNSAGLAIFRYQTSCGTVYGHTGNTAGYTQFIAATADGKHAVVVSINAQITPKADATRFADLRHIFQLAVCAAV